MNFKPSNDFRKQRILNAVRKVLVQKGYEGTTISLIAAEAEVSRGLLHYYFKNKEEIVAEAIKESTKIGAAMITDVFQQHRTPDGYAAGITGILKDAIVNDSDFLYLYIEGFATARHSRIIGKEISDSYVKWKQALEIGLKQAQDEQTISPRLPINTLTALISALFDGMWLQFLAEPELVNNALVQESLELCIADLLRGRP